MQMCFREDGYTSPAVAVEEIPLWNHLHCEDQQQRQCKQKKPSHETPQSFPVL